MKSNEMRRNVMERGAGAHIVKSNGWSGDKSQYVRSKYTEKENVPSRIWYKKKSSILQNRLSTNFARSSENSKRLLPAPLVSQQSIIGLRRGGFQIFHQVTNLQTKPHWAKKMHVSMIEQSKYWEKMLVTSCQWSVEVSKVLGALNTLMVDKVFKIVRKWRGTE